MANATSKPSANSGEIVVSLRHADLVLEELERLVDMQLLSEAPTVAKSNEVLGLGLIRLEFRRDPVAIEAVGIDGAGVFGVDEVLRMVRASCVYRFRDWQPEIGKNRVLSGIAGEGGFLSGGGGFLSGGGGFLSGGGGFLSGGGGFLSGGGGFLSGGGGGLPEPTDSRLTPPRGNRGSQARVALLDTPLVRGTSLGQHVEYEGKYLPKKEPIPAEAGHAEFVLGLIERAAPGAFIEIRPTLDGYAVADAWTVACAMAELAGSDVDIVNLSLGCYTLDNQPPLLLQRAIDVLSPSTLVIAAAGNHRQPMHPRAFWPAAFDEVVAVGAVDSDGRLASFSPRAPWVDVKAPGVDVTSTYLDGEVELRAATDRNPARIEAFSGYAKWHGTSFAAATVTGEIAASVTANRSARKALDHILDLPNGKTSVRRYRYQ